jgi:hypothetical protein
VSSTIFNPTIDSFMSGVSTTTNYGTLNLAGPSTVYAGGSKTELTRPILNFDITSIAGQTLVTAKLRLYVGDLYNPVGAKVYRCTRPATWTELGVTWNKYDGTNNWTTAGGDYDAATPTPVAFTTGVSQFAWFEITGLLAFATDAIANRSNVVSLILRLDDEAPDSNDGIGYSQSREDANAPQLVIEYGTLPSAETQTILI